MNEIENIFTNIPSKFIPGVLDRALVYYFSVGEEKWTVFVDGEKCEAKRGKLVDNADCMVKSDPKLFADLVLRKKMPGTFDIMRGKIKTNDINLLKKMAEVFGLTQK